MQSLKSYIALKYYNWNGKLKIILSFSNDKAILACVAASDQHISLSGSEDNYEKSPVSQSTQRQ